MTTRNGLIVMTALVPTRGHQYLVEFASRFLSVFDAQARLYVMVCSRDSIEPIAGKQRTTAFKEQFKDFYNVEILDFNDDRAPQNPSDTTSFWDYWRNAVQKNTPIKSNDFLFASEQYGHEFAKQLDCEFVPVDIAREIYSCKGSDVRFFPIENFHFIMPTFQKYLRTVVTIFGAESTGKTTMAKTVTNLFNNQAFFLHEWARPYLETVGSEVTDEKMLNICRGQYAMMQSIRNDTDSPIIIQDTDLLSTIGYYRIYNGKEPYFVRDLFEKTKSDLYILMNSNIPFEPDALRYGGSIRESTDLFWLNLLEEFNCNYHIVEETNQFTQTHRVAEVIRNQALKHPVYQFVRD